MLVLLALAVQLCFHSDMSTGWVGAGRAIDSVRQQQLPASNHDSDQPSDPWRHLRRYRFWQNTALFATLPVLLLPQAAEFLY